MRNRTRAPRRKVYVYEASQRHDPEVIVKALISGLDISLIDPKLYPSVRPQLKPYILRFQDQRDQPAADKIIWMIKYMDEYLERENISSILSKKHNTKVPRPPALSGKRLEGEIDAILNGSTSHKIYSKQEKKCIIRALRQKKQNY